MIFCLFDSLLMFISLAEFSPASGAAKNTTREAHLHSSGVSGDELAKNINSDFKYLIKVDTQS